MYTWDRRRDFPCALDTVVDCANSPNSAAIAELLLDHGAVWPEEAFDEALLLENIIFANNVALMKLLIGPAKVTKSDLLGISKSPEMMNFLLGHGLDVHEKTSLGEEPIILHAQSLSYAISPHEYESFKVLVSHHKNATKALGNDGETVLAACCQPVGGTADNATLRGIKLMLSLGADHSATDNLGITPLHKAVQTGFVQGIRELVAAGADIECKDQNGLTPLHHAAACKYDDSLREMILLGADLHAKTNAGLTALHVAFRESKRTETDIRYPTALTDRIPIIKLLLSHSMDPNDRSTGGVPALHIPHVAHGDNLKALLDLGADPSERDLEGLLILNALLSGAFNYYEAKMVLKAAGAKVVNLEDCNGHTPLWVASEHCCTQRVKLLLRYGADINAVNGAGQTVLDRVGNWQVGDWQVNYFTEVEVANFMTFMRSKGALRADEISLNTGE
jgi:26S proteasome non-ATPase regulatory subunit 10